MTTIYNDLLDDLDILVDNKDTLVDNNRVSEATEGHDETYDLWVQAKDYNLEYEVMYTAVVNMKLYPFLSTHEAIAKAVYNWTK